LGLTWDCVNGLNRKGGASLTIKQQLQRRNEGEWFITPRTKNNRSRTIPLPELWRRALLDEKSKGRLARAKRAKDLIWLSTPSSLGTSRWVDYNEHNRVWRQIQDDYCYHKKAIHNPSPTTTTGALTPTATSPRRSRPSLLAASPLSRSARPSLAVVKPICRFKAQIASCRGAAHHSV
jgi:hypothetical protein